MTRRHRALVHTQRAFGRRQPAYAAALDEAPNPSLSDELRLFSLTFAGGFLFMAVYLG